MIQNVLAAALAGYLRGFSIEDIKVAIESFIPSPAQTPGRLNLFQFKDYQILLDYAHNEAGLRGLKGMVDRIEATIKIGVIAGIGDRRPEDNQAIGRVAAEMFDEIIIRQDKNLRGRTEAELIDMLKQGIASVSTTKPVLVFPTEKEAISYAVENAQKGALIVLCSDVVPDALAQVMKYKEEEIERSRETANQKAN